MIFKWTALQNFAWHWAAAAKTEISTIVLRLILVWDQASHKILGFLVWCFPQIHIFFPPLLLVPLRVHLITTAVAMGPVWWTAGCVMGTEIVQMAQTRKHAPHLVSVGPWLLPWQLLLYRGPSRDSSWAQHGRADALISGTLLIAQAASHQQSRDPWGLGTGVAHHQ